MRHSQRWFPRAFALSATLSLALAEPARACTQDAMLVFDGSGSMSEIGANGLSEPRILAARRAMHAVLPTVTQLRRFGLILYGPGDPEGCDSVDLRLTPRTEAAGPILAEIDALEPGGNTPLTDAVARAAEVLNQGSGSGVIALVTDGKETCGGAPCQLAATLAEGRPAMTVHVVGFKVRGDHFTWGNSTDLFGNARGHTVARCLADQTGGEYFSAESAQDLIEAMESIFGCPFVS